MECPICSGNMERTRERYSFAGVELGEFEADKCPDCGEVFFTEEASDKIDERAKELGLWGIGRVSRLGYSGNSVIVRIPKQIVDLMKLRRGEQVTVRPEGKRKIVVEVE